MSSGQQILGRTNNVRGLKAARANLLTGQIGQATQAVARHFRLAWRAGSTVVIGSQADWPSNPPFF